MTSVLEQPMARQRFLAIVSSVTLFLSAPQAMAHSWYPIECCSDRDCRELAEDQGETVDETPNGWQLWDGRIIARGIAKPSPDKKFHLCETANKTIICFFVPPGAS
ncbi:hypothetical protein [Microvirga terricola]|uniref:Uncharacterized protein n=1 Tax=Microvirga terricola TaxID=2719797 RepID=A0ABX0VF50_9HYPH|nr:hypothetical protein [Microvirga terricola]NIX78262.1 hypothetical protein [Microvirga terricola]